MEESDSTATEMSDSEASYSSMSSDFSVIKTSKNDKKKDSVPKKSIVEIRQTLKKLCNDDTSTTKELRKDRDFFCIEDTFLTKDLKVCVEGIGQLSFPLEKESVEQMITLSSKAKFGKGRETILDTEVRDTQTIPANKLKIDISSSSLDDLLKRIGAGLNISKSSQLTLHLHNLLIYGPGQFFKKHTDSEKVENMIATLVIVLPYPHEGGELIIEHNKKRHMFFGSKNPEVAKCVAFYSDCAHEIKKVTNGYRVAITYNVVLKSSDVPDVAVVNESLDKSVEDYFNSGQEKLVFGLNHKYSRKSLSWVLLKGADRTRVSALLAVAKKQGRIPCLALTSYHEVHDLGNPYCESPTLIEEETTVDYMINENNTELTYSGYIDEKNEFCCTQKTKDLFKPHETEASGPTGNEGNTEENWYQRACLVVWSSKWFYPEGFKEALSELHQLTKLDGMQKTLIERIKIARKDFAQLEMWIKPNIADMLVDIVIYLNDEEEAKFILGELDIYLMQKECITRLVHLEKMFSSQTWCDIVNIWKSKGYTGEWDRVVNNAYTFVKDYTELIGSQFKSVIVDSVLEEGVKIFITSEERKRINKYEYVYNRKSKEYFETLTNFMKICSLMGKKSLQESLINHVVDSKYSAVSLGELYTKLMDELKPEYLSSFEKIRNLAEKEIDARLLSLKKDNGWTFPIEVTCKCKECSSVAKFFTSKTSASFVIECTKQVHDHLYNIYSRLLNMYQQPCKMLSVRVGRKYKITFEKLPRLLEDRQMLNDDLVKFKERFLHSNNAFVGVKVENEDASSSVDVSIIEVTENIKTELQDDIDENVQFPKITEVDIKPEITEVDIKPEITQPEEDDLTNFEQEIPKKRKKKTN